MTVATQLAPAHGALPLGDKRLEATIFYTAKPPQGHPPLVSLYTPW